MGVREAVVVLVAVCVAAAPQDDITLTSSGYNGVKVAISDQLDENKCDQYINRIKDMVEAASRLMFNATGEKVFFGDVVIVVPQSWTCQGIQSAQLVYSWDSAHLRVGRSHYLFGDNPWTQQLGGCGEPGDWIYLPEKFLVNNTNVGSPGSILVHEWAKYRWGVFEEYGHAHDPIFPPAYRDENNTFTPTYCTDHLLEGVMSCPEGGTEAECQFTPELIQNTTVTSSLLAAPFLDTVFKFCDSGSHNSAAPTKHNLLCDQSSANDVMARHADMKGNPVSLMNTNFTVVRAAEDWPRMVLLVEYSSIMGQNHGQLVRGRWAYLRDNVRQFIKVEAAADTYMGVVVFGSSLNSSPLLLLSQDTNRETLANYILDGIPGPDQGKKDLLMAIKRGAEVLGPEGGTLILLTENLEEYTTSQNLVEAAANNSVWPILYPSNPQVSTEIYEQLARISLDTSVLTVHNNLFNFAGENYQSVDNSVDLHYNLLTAAASPATRVAKGNCDTKNCTIPLEIPNNTGYISQAIVKVFCSAADDIEYLRITVTDPNGGNLDAIKQGTSWLFQVSSLQTGPYLVSISYSKNTVNVVAELWATLAPLDMQVSVWSPKGLHNLPYSPGIAPCLLAKVTNNASWPVLFADVTAQVANKINPGISVNITLNDSGTGGDVTGQDGIYSGYLVGFEPKMEVTITLTVTDNNGKAKVVNPSLRAAPTTPGNVACCGSQLDVSNLQLQNPGSFAFSSAVSGRFTGVSPGTLPPGRVTDLQASDTGQYVTLTFTAPGAQLDQGQAEWYVVNSQADGVNLHIANISGLPSGSLVTEQVELPDCEKVYTLTVVAYFNGVYGSTSNNVRKTASCGSTPGGSGNLSSGDIAGITIGCILAVLLIVLIIYLCLNRDHLSDLWVWKILTCRCCRNNKDDDLYNPPSQARRSDVIRSNTSPSKPVRDLTDLYSRPNVDVKRERRQERPQDGDDGGFGEHQRQRDNVQRRAGEDVESLASSLSTLPINKVGLPVGGDNHAYDDGPYPIYSNAPPVPRYPRANTQV